MADLRGGSKEMTGSDIIDWEASATRTQTSGEADGPPRHAARQAELSTVTGQISCLLLTSWMSRLIWAPTEMQMKKSWIMTMHKQY
ncbi:hypothetical protein EYF80_057849 [Liparis tanakae]|uniref:Uncharacterized protein n=1 Tax=Liparis tanakae TaxID=230148 RepID=A0A4Z2EUD1_9TELE|nr:hypothetical protein EYF80_057849 [Liparis tanakae]